MCTLAHTSTWIQILNWLLCAQLQAEVAGLYEQYRHEVDARKILVADYNDLKYRQQEQKTEEGGGAVEEREDPVVLKLKLT